MLAALLVAVPLALAAPGASPQAPPQGTLERAQAALELLEGRGFVGSYLMTTRTHVVATGEKGPEDALEVREVTIAPDGTKTSRIVRAVEDGRDVTAKRAAEDGQHDEGPGEHGGDNEIELDLLPIGRSARHYAFGPAKVENGVAVATFAPRRGVESDELGRGSLAWDEATGDPLWIDTGLAEHRTGVKELSLRFEFARQGDALYPRAIRTRTKAGIPLLFKLRLAIDIEISELDPADAGSQS